jgi:hypothetical protein
MNRSQRVSNVLAEEIKKTVRKKTGCKIEIRAVKGSKAWTTGERLMSGLRAGGLKTELVEVPLAPRGELLIESSHVCAEIALSLQSAFLTSGIEVQLLVHNKAKPNQIVLHLGTEE